MGNINNEKQASPHLYPGEGVLLDRGGEDGDVALLEALVHHELVVPDADATEGLQGGRLDGQVLVVHEVVDCIEHGGLSLAGEGAECREQRESREQRAESIFFNNLEAC